jgi:hypothetical protein
VSLLVTKHEFWKKAEDVRILQAQDFNLGITGIFANVISDTRMRGLVLRFGVEPIRRGEVVPGLTEGDPSMARP